MYSALTTWKLILAYDGTDFHGWQIQPGNPTLQGTLSDAITRVTGERVLPQGSGRTDAGVHAHGQVASFALSAPIPEENLQRALNRALPAAIRVLSARHAAADFHARHSSRGKIYQYRIFPGAVCPPFMGRFAQAFDRSLDLSAMQEAAQQVIGEHDFTSFAACDPDRTVRLQASTGGESSMVNPVIGNVRTIKESHWEISHISLPFGGDGCDPLLTYTVCGTGFLHHMVRNLVGTFLEVGLGRITPQEIKDILHGRDRTLAGPTAAARGLWLMKVLY